MYSKQIKKWLEQQGDDFSARQGFAFESIFKLQTNHPPMHGTTELGKGLEAAIKRQLGLK
jgi:mRNA interferase HicA